MPVASLLRPPRLPFLAAVLFAPAALANPTLPWTSAQTRGLDYEPFFLGAIQAPVFDPGSNPGNSPRFGHSVALDGDWMLVGMPDRFNASGQPNGGVFLYQRQGVNWVQRDRIQFGVGGAARCGQAVALKNNVALIGCPGFTSGGLDERGRTLIYRVDPADGQMTLQETLLGAAAGEQCGHAVAVDGTGLANSTYAAMGCPGRGVVGAGSRGGVSLYRFSLGAGGVSWSAWGTLSPDGEGDPQSAQWRFGSALSMERIGGDAPLVRLLVGMPGARPDGIVGAGLALLYERPVNAGSWEQVRRFARVGGHQGNAEFGFSVSLSGAQAAIGAPGAGHDASAARAGMVYRFRRSPATGAWVSSPAVGVDMARLNPSGGSRFGHAVAMANNELWVGQPVAVANENLGAVWRYRSVIGLTSAPEAARLLTDIHQGSLVRQSVSGTGLGHALSVDGASQRIAVGGPLAAFVPGTTTGLAFVYQQADRVFTDRFSPDHLRPGAQFRDCEDCPTMVMIPGGSFIQGAPASEPESIDWERPQRQVSVPAFALAQTPVTFAQWDACVADGSCTHNPNDQGWGRGDRPVINISWSDAQEYLAWLSAKSGHEYRLPSESEWEYAARAGTSGRFSTGDCITTGQANFWGNNPVAGCPSGVVRARSLPVASFAPNAFGLYETHGNGWEWVQDCWNDNYVDAPTDGSAWMTGDCSRAVGRGGSLMNAATELRSANRRSALREGPYADAGFRVARSISP